MDAAKSSDGKVRKATVLVCKDGQMKTFNNQLVLSYYSFPLKMFQIPGKKTVEARINRDPLGEECYARHAFFFLQFHKLMIIE